MTRWQPRITAIDPSLAGTGLCRIVDGKVVQLETLKSKLTGHDRLAWILAEVYSAAIGLRNRADLVVIEGPSYGSQGGQSGHHERAGLWWLITHKLWGADVPYAVVSPSTLKKYATGKGNASKDDMLIAAIKRWGDVADVRDNNQADALALGAAASDHLGVPLADMPAASRVALAAVDWPQLPIDDEPLAVAS